MFEPGETLPLVKKEEEKKHNSNRLNQEPTICSIKCGLLILFILLISVLSFFFCLHYLEVVKLPDKGLKTREVDTQKETMLKKTNDDTETIAEQKSCHAVDRESTNLTSRSQLRSSEGNTYEESSSAVKKHEQKMFEPGETLPLIKKEEGKKQNCQESICSIKCGLLILFILLTSVLSLFFCLHYLEVVKLPDRGLKTREETQKETMLNEEISKLENNASALRQQVDELKAVIASRGDDINRINEMAPEHTSVMLLGGWHDGITNSTIIYNSMEKSWKNCNLTLPSTLRYYGAALLSNEIYIFGGYDGTIFEPLKSLYKLGADNKWERMADMNEERGLMLQSSIVFNSEIWVIGGHNWTNALKSVEKYNPKTNKWTEMPELNESREVAAATVVDGKIYVSGGWDGWRSKNSVEVYDPEKEKWEIFNPSLPYGMDSHILIGNHSHLIVIGGDLSNHEATNRVWKMNVLDPKREWKEMPNLRQRRHLAGAAIIADQLMVFGGINFISRVDFVEIFDGVEWKKGAPFSEIGGVFAYTPLTNEQERLFLNRFCQNS